MIRQQRCTGGIWICCGGAKGIIDPGPGSLAHVCAAVPSLSPEELDFVLLTHKHIDHSGDANVMIECMTGGGFKKNGLIIAPSDALSGDDHVIMRYSQERAARIERPHNGKIIKITPNLTAEAVLHLHGTSECYGYIFRTPGLPEWGMISDSRMLPSFTERYRNCSFVSVNTTFPDRKKRLDHISVAEAKELLTGLNAKHAVFTHLCSTMTAPEGKHFLENLSTENTHVTPAEDGMIVDLATYEVSYGGEKPYIQTPAR
ncbi:MAG: MBL fold metallo-hydrolase [Synergistes sp.]|nr:MBL fold metallo-hydrolase [Synergistes sp.]